MQQVKVKNVYDHMGTTELFLGRGWKMVENINDADIVCLNGGMDIATEIYGETSAYRGVPETMSPRDKMEVAMYNMALERGKFILGICRGAQLANCLNGGKLWQHISNHGTGHMMYDLKTHEHIFTTSVHHQEMIPGPGAEIIAVAAQATQKIDARGVQMFQPFKKTDEDGDDVEVLWYPRTRSLCIQGHPEFAPETNFAKYCFKLTESLRLDGVWPAKTASSVAVG
jgi:gamma-glutamyl-gamma-aminobutyrate hydrolase PuuD